MKQLPLTPEKPLSRMSQAASTRTVHALLLTVVLSQTACAQLQAQTPPPPKQQHPMHAEYAQRAQARWAQADTDKDGALSKAELQAAGMRRLLEHFDVIDTNKDGKITQAEVRAAFQAKRQALKPHADKLTPAGSQQGGMQKEGTHPQDHMHFKSPEQRRAAMQARFDQADTNKDGGLSKAELQAANMLHLLSRFDQLDTNKDGKITADELRTAWEGRARRAAPPVAPGQAPSPSSPSSPSISK